MALLHSGVITERRAFYNFHAATVILFHILKRGTPENLRILGRYFTREIKFCNLMTLVWLLYNISLNYIFILHYW